MARKGDIEKLPILFIDLYSLSFPYLPSGTSIAKIPPISKINPNIAPPLNTQIIHQGSSNSTPNWKIKAHTPNTIKQKAPRFLTALLPPKNPVIFISIFLFVLINDFYIYNRTLGELNSRPRTSPANGGTVRGEPPQLSVKNFGPCQIRTGDLPRARRMLFQLS